MASASPAAHPARPSGLVDFRKHAEYPILLGESLKGDDSLATRLIDLRFNWQPKAGLKEFESTLSSGGDGYTLDVNDPTTLESAYRYSGHERNNGDSMSSFALVFDMNKSAFILESISRSVDLNLESAASQSKDDVRRRAKLPDGPQQKPLSASKNGVDDDEPDPSNPFDFRNYLDEAKESVEKDRRKPKSHAGLSHSHERLRQSCCRSNLLHPVINSGTACEKPRAPARKPKADPPARKPKPAQERKSARQVPLSTERISDSDDELSDTVTVAVSQPTKPAAPPKGHSRNASGNIGRSPHIVVNDGDLEIDMGSPPPELRARKRRIDAEAFRSHTGTPVVGDSQRVRPAPRDVEMKDADDQDEDGDVDELDLGSPQAKTTQAGRGKQGHAPTPPNQSAIANDEDDGVAELEDLLGGDDDMDNSGHGLGLGLGLGISGAADEDSEVSEEE